MALVAIYYLLVLDLGHYHDSGHRAHGVPRLGHPRVRRILLLPFPGLRAVQGSATSVPLLMQLDDHPADTANRAMTRASLWPRL